jgi:hypothetical protein
MKDQRKVVALLVKSRISVMHPAFKPRLAALDICPLGREEVHGGLESKQLDALGSYSIQHKW